MSTSERDEALDNHFRYYKDTRPQCKILSLEGRYVPLRGDDDYEGEPLPPAMKPIDQKQAMAIEKIIINKLAWEFKACYVVNTFYKSALVGRWFYANCRKLKVNPRKFDDNVETAKRMIWNNYQKYNI